MKPGFTGLARSFPPASRSERLRELIPLESAGIASQSQSAELRGLLEHPDCPVTAELRRREILGLLNHREEAHLIARREFPGAGLDEIGYELRVREMLSGELGEEDSRRLSLVRDELARIGPGSRANC